MVPIFVHLWKIAPVEIDSAANTFGEAVAIMGKRGKI
jgi:hypothetical protein